LNVPALTENLFTFEVHSKFSAAWSFCESQLRKVGVQPHSHMRGGTFVANRELISRSNEQETEMPIILWLLGVPLGLVVVLWLLHVI
jgi:hypothetical protein